jgi:aerobic-type carbon monoxide dehydrogenase small subunit (CoxS/CutS family)
MAPSLLTVSFTVNGQPVTCLVEPRRTLLDCLREDVHLHGTHTGCEHGVCGCCNVSVDGEVVRCCLLLAAQAEGCEIGTVTGHQQILDAARAVIAAGGAPTPSTDGRS